MRIILETPRLLLREFTSRDAGLILALNADPAVTAFTGDPVLTLEQAEQVLLQVILPQYTQYLHGRWAVHVKTQGSGDPEFIGWCGLKALPERQEIDLGYRFFPLAWGKGYATEAARATLQYGFEKLGLPRIVGRAMPGNRASWRVLEKCGMRFLYEEVVDEHPARTYEALNPFIRS